VPFNRNHKKGKKKFLMNKKIAVEFIFVINHDVTLFSAAASDEKNSLCGSPWHEGGRRN
jgi:hypothetical protein